MTEVMGGSMTEVMPSADRKCQKKIPGLVALTDLAPEWSRSHDGCVVGVRFLCPDCRRFSTAILFANGFDSTDGHFDPKVDKARTLSVEERGWQRTGRTFETLTLTPSIDLTAQGHWHGFIANGVCT